MPWSIMSDTDASSLYLGIELDVWPQQANPTSVAMVNSILQSTWHKQCPWWHFHWSYSYWYPLWSERASNNVALPVFQLTHYSSTSMTPKTYHLGEDITEVQDGALYNQNRHDDYTGTCQMAHKGNFQFKSAEILWYILTPQDYAIMTYWVGICGCDGDIFWTHCGLKVPRIGDWEGDATYKEMARERNV